MSAADRHSPALFAILLGSLALLPLSTDLYLASLPGLARHFDVPAAAAQATLSAFIVGFALGQLVYGPMSDRWGRRPILLAGLAIYLAAAVVCASAGSIGTLVIGRFWQGVGACAGTVVARAAVRDVYGAEGAARMLAYIAAGVSLFPLLGPVAGGFIEAAFGWRWNLALIGVFGAVLLLAAQVVFVEPSRNFDPTATRILPMLANFRRLIADRRFRGYVMCLAGSYAGLFAFISGSAFVLIGVLGVSPRAFGFWFSATVAGYLAGSFFTGRVARRFGAARMMRQGTLLQAMAGTTALALAVAGVHSAPAVVLPMVVYMFATAITLPNSMAGALSGYPRMAGAASSLMGFTQMLAAAGVGYLIGRWFDGTPVPMAAGVAAMSWTVFAAYWTVVWPAER